MQVIVFILAPKNSGLNKYKEISLSFFSNLDSARVIEARGEDVPFLMGQFEGNNKRVIGLTGEDLYNEYILKQGTNNLKVIKKIEWTDPEAFFGKPACAFLDQKTRNLLTFRKT